jgi:hypothetical protein
MTVGLVTKATLATYCGRSHPRSDNDPGGVMKSARPEVHEQIRTWLRPLEWARFPSNRGTG